MSKQIMSQLLNMMKTSTLNTAYKSTAPSTKFTEQFNIKIDKALTQGKLCAHKGGLIGAFCGAVLGAAYVYEFGSKQYAKAQTDQGLLAYTKGALETLIITPPSIYASSVAGALWGKIVAGVSGSMQRIVAEVVKDINYQGHTTKNTTLAKGVVISGLASFGLYHLNSKYHKNNNAKQLEQVPTPKAGP